MDQPNLPVVPKKFWKMVIFMLRKGISKGKLIIDLNTMLIRGKIAASFISHHNRRSHERRRLPSDSPVSEYYSCSNSPVFSGFHLPNFHLSKKNKHNHLFSCTHAPATVEDDFTVQAVIKALEIMQHSEAPSPSPALPGFGRSPLVRQLRITDSPFPLNVEGDSHVDEAAEKFIERFYKDLWKQNAMGA